MVASSSNVVGFATSVAEGMLFCPEEIAWILLDDELNTAFAIEIFLLSCDVSDQWKDQDIPNRRQCMQTEESYLPAQKAHRDFQE